MNLFKMFVLTALAGLMAMAFAGASSAMAESTALCNQDPGTGAHEVCPAGHLLTHVHSTSAGKGKLLASGLTVECDVLFLTTSVEALGSPQMLEGNFTYTNCGSCTFEEVNGPSKVTVLKIAHETVSLTNTIEVHFNCSGVNCYYRGEAMEGSGKGPLLSTLANGEASVIGKAMKKVKGLFCGNSAFLDLTMVTLSAAYIEG